MRRFVAILEGESPLTAKPLIATEQPAVVRATVAAIRSVLEREEPEAELLRRVFGR